MTERPPEDRPDGPEDRPGRRRGPLGDDPETRQVPREDEEATRPIPYRREPTGEEPDAKETRVIRTTGDAPAPGPTGTPGRAYYESPEEREDRLRDLYGGVDWLASFLGFVFAAVLGALFALVATLVLSPLNFSPDLGAQLGPAVITGLVVVGILLFLTYFCGGYVAGRLARFDGGFNGAMTLVWTALIGAVVFVAGSFLPGAAGEAVRGFVGTVSPTFEQLLAQGAVGIAILVAAGLLMLLGGFLGGRAGANYHAEIDRTT